MFAGRVGVFASVRKRSQVCACGRSCGAVGIAVECDVFMNLEVLISLRLCVIRARCTGAVFWNVVCSHCCAIFVVLRCLSWQSRFACVSLFSFGPVAQSARVGELEAC